MTYVLERSHAVMAIFAVVTGSLAVWSHVTDKRSSVVPTDVVILAGVHNWHIMYCTHDTIDDELYTLNVTISM